jgi:hypothetical protein
MKTPINFAVFRESRDQPDFEDDLNTLSDSVNKFFTRLSPRFSCKPDEGGALGRSSGGGKGLPDRSGEFRLPKRKKTEGRDTEYDLQGQFFGEDPRLHLVDKEGETKQFASESNRAKPFNSRYFWNREGDRRASESG